MVQFESKIGILKIKISHPKIGRVNYENLLFVYILNVLKSLRTVSDLIAKSEKFYAKSDLTKLSWDMITI